MTTTPTQPTRETAENIPTIPEALLFRIEQYGHTTRQAAKMMGLNEHHLSELLAGKIKASTSMIPRLHDYGIPPIVLVQRQAKLSALKDKVKGEV